MTKDEGFVGKDRTLRKGHASQRIRSVVQEATEQDERRPEKSTEAVTSSRAGGLKRAQNLTAEMRLEIAKSVRTLRRSA